MAQEPLPQLDAKTLAEELTEILIRGSLYRNFIYAGEHCHHWYHTSGDYPRKLRCALLPKQLEIFCSHEKCKKETRWDIDKEQVFLGSNFIEERYYTCRNCGEKHQYYEFIWQEKKDHNLFIKIGQYPPLSIAPEPKLAEALGPEDAELYKKGLINFNFGHGIGAVGYFRRVLENKINALLDLIAEAARNENVKTEALEQVGAVKESHRVEDKIDLAAKILPGHLKPGGHNPLSKLYKPLSAGLHGESDDDCLAVFSEARFVFEYLFKNLTESNEEARKYVQQLSAPVKAAKVSNDEKAKD
jgi:hypothetical protein